jgi:RNA polymerase sigma factor (sigma-70 family)
MTRNVFNDIIHNIHRRLFGIAFRILRNREEAEDVVQEVFLKMWMMKDKLDLYKDPAGLAVTITKNNCIDRIRKLKHIDNEEYASGLQVADSEPTPFQQLEKNETTAIISKIIGKLPQSYREIIQMREIDGLSYEEIAMKNNMNINTLRVSISRARQMIREDYLKYNYEQGKIR